LASSLVTGAIDEPFRSQIGHRVALLVARDRHWWTSRLPDPNEAVRAWIRLLRPGGRLVMIEGQWRIPDRRPGPYDHLSTAIRWSCVIPATAPTGILKPLVQTLQVDDLSGDPDLWGKPVDDERFAIIGITPAAPDATTESTPPGEHGAQPVEQRNLGVMSSSWTGGAC
jgi:SAM-dependent methyltransferase